MTMENPDAKHEASSSSTRTALAVLYDNVLRHRPAEPGWELRDRFLLSKGHGPAAYYTTLARHGYFPEAWLDGFMVAADLAEARPDLYHLLATVPLHFHFRDDTSEHEHDATVLDVDGSEQLRAVRFSNHSAQPFLIDPQLMERYYEAYTMFGQMRESATCRLQLDLQAGDLYIIDNRRVLHGRTGFSGGGARHLQSCYIERDEFISRLAMLDRQLGCEQR